jgi:hypothetical protein
MDVDEAAGKPGDELGAEDAHVFREHDEVRLVGIDEGGELRLVNGPIEVLMREVVEGEVEPPDQRFQSGDGC